MGERRFGRPKASGSRPLSSTARTHVAGIGREVAGSNPARSTQQLHAVVVNSADTSVVQTEKAGSMPAGRSRCWEEAADAGGAEVVTGVERKVPPRSRPPALGAQLTAGCLALTQVVVRVRIPRPQLAPRWPNGRGDRFKIGSGAGSSPARGTHAVVAHQVEGCPGYDRGGQFEPGVAAPEAGAAASPTGEAAGSEPACCRFRVLLRVCENAMGS
jgi:hypothetical protein